MKALTLVPSKMPRTKHLRAVGANIIELLATIVARYVLRRVTSRFAADFDEDIAVVFALLGVMGGHHDLTVTAKVVNGGFGVGVPGGAFEALYERAAGSCVLARGCEAAGY